MTSNTAKKIGFGEATESVSIHMLVRVSATPSNIHFRSTHGLLPTLRDGTDPRLGGLRAAPSDVHTLVCIAPGVRL